MSSFTSAQAALNWGAEHLLSKSPSSRLDALLLLARAMHCSKEQIIAGPQHPLTAAQEAQFNQFIARRARYEPIAYILGSQEFWGLPFKVSPAVLIPRPETELLVALALEALAGWQGDRTPRVLDLGAGSGCIACAIAHSMRAEGRSVQVVALEGSGAAVEIAHQNVLQLGVNELVELRHGDWNEFTCAELFDVVVSNPPYIAQGDTNRSPETDFEPKEALFSGVSGVEAIAAIVKLLPRMLVPGGVAFMEIGIDQAARVKELSSSTLQCCGFKQDLSGRDRVAVFRFSPAER